MALAGLTQAKLAEMSDCTPNQMGVFLKGTGFLNKSSLEKCLSALGVRLDVYANRYKLAQKAAKSLRDIDKEDIMEMSKEEMATQTGLKEILALFDVSEKELDAIIDSQIVDYECTYPFFQAMVLHLMQVGEDPTPKKVEMSFSDLVKILPIVSFIPVLGIAGIIGMAAGALFGTKNNISTITNAFTPLLMVAKQIIKK
ncbi:MAG: helix-turn-helix transcriptional regulator [Treponema sp.]|nr:helix-turn-helix transcriptional regulator [Treponema sp.]